MDAGLLAEARSYAQRFGGAGLVVRRGKVVASWGDPHLRYDLKSTTKSIGATALGLALADGLLTLDDRAADHMPGFGSPPAGNESTGWLDDISMLHLATHTAGFAKAGGYPELERVPGTAWSYSDGGFNWLADVLTTRFGEDLNGLLFRRVFTRLGITSADLVWRSHAYREDTLNGVKRREFGSGIRASVDAMARIGYLYLRGGVWDGSVVLPPAFVDTVGRPSSIAPGLPVVDGSNPPGTSDRYGVAWFTNTDGTLPEVPPDAYWAWGLLDSLIVVIPSLDIVVARTGNGLGRSGWNADYSYIAPFITPIARAAIAGGAPALVPVVTGLPQSEAEATLVAANLQAGAITHVLDSATPPGYVISQDPVAGSEVAGGTPVALSVSQADDPVEVPGLLGMPLADALSALQALGLNASPLLEAPSSSTPAGSVTAQDPAASTLVAAGSNVGLTIAVAPGPTESGGWLRFDGVNDVASVPSSATLTLSGAMSIEARIRPRTISKNKQQDRILRKGVDYELMTSTSSAGCSGSTRGSLQLSVTIGGVARKVCGGSLALNAWQHVAGTYDGSELVLYVDGSRVAGLPVSGAIKRSATLVTIGNVKALSRPYDGDLRAVALWGRALSATEALERAARPLTGTEPGLLAHWPAQDGIGQAIRDATANANHGKLGLTNGSEVADPTWTR